MHKHRIYCAYIFISNKWHKIFDKLWACYQTTVSKRYILYSAIVYVYICTCTCACTCIYVRVCVCTHTQTQSPCASWFVKHAFLLRHYEQQMKQQAPGTPEVRWYLGLQGFLNWPGWGQELKWLSSDDVYKNIFCCFNFLSWHPGNIQQRKEKIFKGSPVQEDRFLRWTFERIKNMPDTKIYARGHGQH